MTNLFEWARELEIVEDYFQEARLAAIETYRENEPPIKAVEATRRRIRQMLQSYGVIRERQHHEEWKRREVPLKAEE